MKDLIKKEVVAAVIAICIFLCMIAVINITSLENVEVVSRGIFIACFATFLILLVFVVILFDEDMFDLVFATIIAALATLFVIYFTVESYGVSAFIVFFGIICVALYERRSTTFKDRISVFYLSVMVEFIAVVLSIHFIQFLWERML